MSFIKKIDTQHTHKLISLYIRATMIWGNSRMIIAPFCLYFRLIHFIFSSKTQKIVFNKLEYRF